MPVLKFTIVQSFHKWYNGKENKGEGEGQRPTDKMKKRIISAVLAATLVITSAMPAFATPNQEVIENQKKYDELTQKIEDINT